MKKVFVSLLGLSGFLNENPLNVSYVFNNKLKKELGYEDIYYYPNMLVLVLDKFKDYRHICIGTEKSIQFQQKLLRDIQLKIDIDCKYINIPNEKEYEYSYFLDKLNSIIKEYDKVIVDITHGFRHLPILSILSLFNQHLKNQTKIEYILFAKEVKHFKEFEIIDFKENFETLNFSLMLSTFNNNYTLPNNLSFSNNRYKDIYTQLSLFIEYLNLNINSIMNTFIIDDLLKNLKQIKTIDKDLESEINILIYRLKEIKSLKNEDKWKQHYMFSKLMYENNNYLQSIILLYDSIIFYCIDSLKKIKDVYNDITKYERNHKNKSDIDFLLKNETRNLFLYKNIHTGKIYSSKTVKLVVDYLNNINDIDNFINLIKNIERTRNEHIHGLLGVNNKQKYDNLFQMFEKFCIKQDILSNIVKEKKDLYIDSIIIKNYFSIKNIEITNLKDKKEIYFVGGNGEGKTILLQAIILAIKKNYPGHIIEYIRDIEDEMQLLIKYENSIDYSSNNNIKNAFAYGINRNKIREKFDKYGYSGIFDTSDFKDTTFLRNPLELLSMNSKIVDNFIEKLNKYILINDLKIQKNEKNEILFMEQGTKTQFEILSEGYKSTIIWICDLVSRLLENNKSKTIKNISEFKAIVLIDEVDLYLHPKWKYSFVHNLRKIFPNIQFIMITHSLVTILGASKDAVFYKVYKEHNETKISKPIENIKNLMANTLSTSPLFDMATARARNSDENIDTSDDYLYAKIHKKIAERVKNKNIIIDKDIENMIDEELDKILKEQKK